MYKRRDDSYSNLYHKVIVKVVNETIYIIGVCVDEKVSVICATLWRAVLLIALLFLCTRASVKNNGTWSYRDESKVFRVDELDFGCVLGDWRSKWQRDRLEEIGYGQSHRRIQWNPLKDKTSHFVLKARWQYWNHLCFRSMYSNTIRRSTLLISVNQRIQWQSSCPLQNKTLKKVGNSLKVKVT